jgi:hypothetical protein
LRKRARIAVQVVTGAAVLAAAVVAAAGISRDERSAADETVVAESTPTAWEPPAAWVPPAPGETPLDCQGEMQFAPVPHGDHEPSLAPHPDSADRAAVVRSTEPPVPLSFPTLAALTDAMTAQSSVGWPHDMAISLLRYEVVDERDGEANLVGKLGDKRLLLAPAIRQPDGTWAWRDARPVMQPNGAWIMQGTSVSCDDVWQPA